MPQDSARTIQVGEDGTVDPRRMTVARGTTVEWAISRGEAILPVRPNEAGTPRRLAYTAEAGDFTGPLVRAIPGIHAMNLPPSRATDVLPEWIWDEPGFTCVYFRLGWEEVNPAPGVYDWKQLSEWMNKAVLAGRHFGVSVKAGVQQTPRWLFDGTLEDPCPSIEFDLITRLLGLPWDACYQRWYFEMLRELARHIRSFNGWWQRLASVWVSGANHHSSEARLPDRKKGQRDMRPSPDDGGDRPPVADKVVWAEHGYTPDKLYGFFAAQIEVLLEEFPGKDICYQLIQSGFPDVDADDPHNPPGPVTQTEEIIRRGRRALGNTWIVQHLGVGVLPDEDCPGRGWHFIEWLERRGVFDWAGSGFPNNWALRAGLEGSPTAWQTINELKPKHLESAIENAWFNSDGIWLEVYHDNVKPFYDAGSAPLGESGLTLADWSRRFYEWRMKGWGDEMGDPFPTTHRHTFTDPGTYPYVLSRHPETAAVVEVE